jgi:hypothetical protein
MIHLPSLMNASEKQRSIFCPYWSSANTSLLAIIYAIFTIFVDFKYQFLLGVLVQSKEQLKFTKSISASVPFKIDVTQKSKFLDPTSLCH